MVLKSTASAGPLGAAAVAITGALLLGCSGSGSDTGLRQQKRLKSLDGSAFATSYPAGWTLAVKHGPAGSARYQLSSTGAPVNGVGIPALGSIGITIDETPTSALSRFHLAGARPDTTASRQSALQLLPHVAGTPRVAEGVALASPPRGTTLAGVDAAEESYSYTDAGRENTQVDVLSQRGGRIVLIELDTEPSLGRAGEAALEAVTGNWRWR